MKVRLAQLVLVLAFLAALPLLRAQQQPIISVDVIRIGVLNTGDSALFVQVIEGGAGYITVPKVTIVGDGTGAKATAYLSDEGSVEGIEITDGGSGYRNAQVVIDPPPAGGTQAIGVVRIGDLFSRPNEAFGPARNTIGITAQAMGTYMVGSFTYSFFVNGVSIGETISPVPPDAPPPTAFWTPPQPGSYFITVEADDGVSKVTSLAVRFFATGTTIKSPLTNTLVPQGSSVVIQADATVSRGFIREIQFFDNGVPIGSADGTIPYSLVYEVPGAVGSTHEITAQATTNTGGLLAMSDPITLNVVTAITPLPRSAISSPFDGAVIVIPNGGVLGSVPVTVDAASRPGGLVSKVELYVDGVLYETKNAFPYRFDWKPTLVGSYRMVALTFDDKNNVIASPVITVSVSMGSPPSVMLMSPAEYSVVPAGLVVNLAATAHDLDGTISSVSFFANGIALGTANTLPYAATWKPTTAGTYLLTAQATDNAGNIMTSSARTAVVLANEWPTSAISSPASGAILRSGMGTSVAATASDLDGTIASVEFFANGVSIGKSDRPPYKVQWTPLAEGVYRLSATAIDNAGALGVSEPVLVSVSATASGAVYTGTYMGAGESGNFAVATIGGTKAALLAFSTLSGAKKTYAYANIPMDVGGGYALSDTAGRTLVSGATTSTGTSGQLDGGRLTFIGLDTSYFPAGTNAAPGYYEGKVGGRSQSTLAVIVGSDGSALVSVVDGSFSDAGGGGSSKIDSTGAFSFSTIQGNRVAGRVNASTGVITGTLSGTNGGDFTASLQAAGSAANKVQGAAREVLSDVFLPAKGNTYDQVLLEGASASITADRGQITRISFVDLSNDIVQVEFSGAGRLTISLENATGPTTAVNYNQPGTRYMKGHAGIVITGADETTNLTIYSVGRYTGQNPLLFRDGVAYDGVADLAYVAIMSANGKFGGMRTANAGYVAAQGIAGVCAPGVAFSGPVYVGDITASSSATPMLVLGSAAEVQINGGDLWQANGLAVQVAGIERLRFVDGMTSAGAILYAQVQRSRLEKDGIDVSNEIVAPPAY